MFGMARNGKKNTKFPRTIYALFLFLLQFPSVEILFMDFGVWVLNLRWLIEYNTLFTSQH